MSVGDNPSAVAPALASRRRRRPLLPCRGPFLLAAVALWTGGAVRRGARRLDVATARPRHRLRFDWTGLEPTSEVARALRRHQANCSKPLAEYRFRNRVGLGSDLHVWTQALCNAMAMNGSDGSHRLQTPPPWIYNARACGRSRTAMACYFPQAEPACPGDYGDGAVRDLPKTYWINERGPKVDKRCQPLLRRYGVDSDAFRAAAVEFLFTRVSRLVQAEAERQLDRLLGGRPRKPERLITVHVRWGDKSTDMELVPIEEYVGAVRAIVARREAPGQPVNVYLATEDPDAVAAFLQAAPKEWNVFLDQYFTELVEYRIPGIDGNPKLSRKLEGEPGLKALGSLLVAMEADDFVLTTASNWSRLMNELRLTVLESRCRGCTSVIDLRSHLKKEGGVSAS